VVAEHLGPPFRLYPRCSNHPELFTMRTTPEVFPEPNTRSSDSCIEIASSLGDDESEYDSMSCDSTTFVNSTCSTASLRITNSRKDYCFLASRGNRSCKTRNSLHTSDDFAETFFLEAAVGLMLMKMRVWGLRLQQVGSLTHANLNWTNRVTLHIHRSFMSSSNFVSWYIFWMILCGLRG
jgi:hypothetical protein